MQILVVEDDINDIHLLSHQLAKAHIDDHVVFIGDGKEAHDYLLRTPVLPIAIFLDLHLPGIGGVELLERMRQDPRTQAIPVIVMTGFNDPYDMKRCNQLGITAYLQKPIELTTFIKTIAHLFPEIAVLK